MKKLLCGASMIAFGALSLCNSAFANTAPTQKATLKSALNQEMLKSPVGYWLQYSDNGKGQSIIEVYKGKDGKLMGKIIVPFVNIVDDKVEVPDISCKNCGSGDENGYKYDYTKMPANQVQGLKMMWSFTKDDDGSDSEGPTYDDGSILDPSSGKVYSCKMYTTENGKKLNVRGYIGFSLFGRTQTWYRIDNKMAKKYVALCGLTAKGSYPYADTTGKIINKALWEECSNVSIK